MLNTVPHLLPIPQQKYSDFEFILCSLIAEAGQRARNDSRIIALNTDGRDMIPLPVSEIDMELHNDFVNRLASCGWLIAS